MSGQTLHRFDMLVFDMDGVLVDVTQSYRAAIVETVQHFTGIAVSGETVQRFKNEGGWNDDWQLSSRLISDAGVDVPYDSVVEQFQRLFRGPNGYDGLISRERWMPRDTLLERLANTHRLAVFTGRLHEEALVTLKRYAPGVFDPIVAVDHVTRPKPDPEGLLKIREAASANRMVYVGDTVDDAMSAAAAGATFIGIAGRATPRREQTVEALTRLGAVAVLESVNELESLL